MVTRRVVGSLAANCAMLPAMELERLLHNQGFGSRKECRALIAAGRVALADGPASNPKMQVAPAGLDFWVDGQPWRAADKVYLLLNKPAGYECSRAPQHHVSVLRLLPAPYQARGVQPVGRLDADTTGLLLLSDDGQFIHHFTSPRRHVPKTYAATVRHPLDEAQLAALRVGVQLHDEPAPLAALACAARDAHTLLLTIGEGKYHQVKRMVAAAGNRVEALHREAMGELTLPAELAPGQWRALTADDFARLGWPSA